jgi:hypothetical protein
MNADVSAAAVKEAAVGVSSLTVAEYRLEPSQKKHMSQHDGASQQVLFCSVSCNQMPGPVGLLALLGRNCADT